MAENTYSALNSEKDGLKNDRNMEGVTKLLYFFITIMLNFYYNYVKYVEVINSWQENGILCRINKFNYFNYPIKGRER